MTDVGPDARKRFFSRVKKSEGCWLWFGNMNQGGYGYFDANKDRRRIGAHRYSYILANGPIPRESIVCHACDTPKCVRPSHLFVGTTADNVRDRVNKGRSARGAKIRTTKLTPNQVRSIRAQHSNGGVTISAIAKQYGVSFPTVADVVSGRTWRHI